MFASLISDWFAEYSLVYPTLLTMFANAWSWSRARRNKKYWLFLEIFAELTGWAWYSFVSNYTNQDPYSGEALRICGIVLAGAMLYHPLMYYLRRKCCKWCEELLENIKDYDVDASRYIVAIIVFNISNIRRVCELGSYAAFIFMAIWIFPLSLIAFVRAGPTKSMAGQPAGDDEAKSTNARWVSIIREILLRAVVAFAGFSYAMVYKSIGIGIFSTEMCEDKSRRLEEEVDENAEDEEESATDAWWILAYCVLVSVIVVFGTSMGLHKQQKRLQKASNEAPRRIARCRLSCLPLILESTAFAIALLFEEAIDGVLEAYDGTWVTDTAPLVIGILGCSVYRRLKYEPLDA